MGGERAFADRYELALPYSGMLILSQSWLSTAPIVVGSHTTGLWGRRWYREEASSTESGEEKPIQRVGGPMQILIWVLEERL